MAMGKVSSSEVGSLFVQHYASLPVSVRHPKGLLHPWPWLTLFVVFPTGGAIGLWFAHLSADVATGLLVGIGVLGGLLFQVLAWVSSRIAALADAVDGRGATPYELGLVRTLDIARANIAYASFVSLIFVVALGVGAMLTQTPKWLSACFGFLLLHLGTTLLLVLVRINRIGQNDRVATITAHARESEKTLRAVR